MNRDCNNCRHFDVREFLGWCSKLSKDCMRARALPIPVKTLDVDSKLTLFKMIEGECGTEGKHWEAA